VLKISPTAMCGASIMEVASKAGILSLNPSDLVFEASQMGIAYYDYVLSASALPKDAGYQLFCARLDEHTNVEWLVFENFKKFKKNIKKF
jgi:hypothetical protein